MLPHRADHDPLRDYEECLACLEALRIVFSVWMDRDVPSDEVHPLIQALRNAA